MRSTGPGRSRRWAGCPAWSLCGGHTPSRRNSGTRRRPLMALFYSPEHELDVRLTTSFDPTRPRHCSRRQGSPRRLPLALAPYAAWRRASARTRPRAGKPIGTQRQTGCLSSSTRRTGRSGEKPSSAESPMTWDHSSCSSLKGAGSMRWMASGSPFLILCSAFAALLPANWRPAGALSTACRSRSSTIGAAGDNGIVALGPGPGTVALWQVGEQGYALIDAGNQHQAGRRF